MGAVLGGMRYDAPTEGVAGADNVPLPGRLRKAQRLPWARGRMTAGMEQTLPLGPRRFERKFHTSAAP
jgi:hypothetical protein